MNVGIFRIENIIHKTSTNLLFVYLITFNRLQKSPKETISPISILPKNSVWKIMLHIPKLTLMIPIKVGLRNTDPLALPMYINIKKHKTVIWPMHGRTTYDDKLRGVALKYHKSFFIISSMANKADKPKTILS